MIPLIAKYPPISSKSLVAATIDSLFPLCCLDAFLLLPARWLVCNFQTLPFIPLFPLFTSRTFPRKEKTCKTHLSFLQLHRTITEILDRSPKERIVGP